MVKKVNRFCKIFRKIKTNHAIHTGFHLLSCVFRGVGLCSELLFMYYSLSFLQDPPTSCKGQVISILVIRRKR